MRFLRFTGGNRWICGFGAHGFSCSSFCVCFSLTSTLVSLTGSLFCTLLGFFVADSFVWFSLFVLPWISLSSSCINASRLSERSNFLSLSSSSDRFLSFSSSDSDSDLSLSLYRLNLLLFSSPLSCESVSENRFCGRLKLLEELLSSASMGVIEMRFVFRTRLLYWP